MNHIEHMMKLYEEGLDELMGAQKYEKYAHKSDNQEEKNMYRVMAMQELEHAHMLIKDGDKMFSHVEGADYLTTVWEALKKHLLDWHGDIERKLK